MWKRYLVGNLRFVAVVMRDALARRARAAELPLRQYGRADEVGFGATDSVTPSSRFNDA
jgi:hypothetical protein